MGNFGQQGHEGGMSGETSEFAGVDDAKNRGAEHGQSSGPATVASIR